MSVRRISLRLQKILHSLATRVPKIVLHRAEDIFPALNTSLVSSLWLCFYQSAVCFVFHAAVVKQYYIESLFLWWIWMCFFFIVRFPLLYIKVLSIGVKFLSGSWKFWKYFLIQGGYLISKCY